MPAFLAPAAKLVAAEIFSGVIKPFLAEAKEAIFDEAKGFVKDFAADTAHNVITGEMTTQEWAEIAIQGVDVVKNHILSENDLHYIGGKLKFSLRADAYDKVNIYFELYFQDDAQGWHKADSGIDIPASKFKPESADEIKKCSEIVFEVV